MITTIIIPVVSMAALGLIFGAGLAYTLKIFGIEVDPAVALIITKLPGANCGACGKAGCSGFAEALKKGEVMPAGCAVSTDEARLAIAEILGVEFNPKVKTIATVHCLGGKNAVNKYEYKGIESCKAAMLVFGGHKACSYACLGLADCVRSCPFDAILIHDELPVVDTHKCTACGNCVKACPRGIISLEAFDKDKIVMVACRSHDKGPAVKAVCSKGCIACGVCQKLSAGVFKIEDNLAAVDRELAKTKEFDWEKVIEKCPTKVIMEINDGRGTKDEGRSEKAKRKGE